MQAAIFLLKTIVDDLRSEGYEYVVGPLNGSTWNSYRVVEASENGPFFLDVVGKDWYSAQFKTCGFSCIAGYSSTETRSLNGNYERLEKFYRIFMQKGLRIRPLELNHFDEELNRIYQVVCESFKNSFLYSPIGFEEFRARYSKLLPFIDPQFALIAEDQEKAWGFVLALPDPTSLSEKRVVIKTLGIRPAVKVRGLGVVLTEMIHQKAAAENYSSVIHALMYDQNVSSNILADNAVTIRRYTLFGKSLVNLACQ